MIGIIAGFLLKRAAAKGVGLTLPHARRIAKIGLIVAAAVLAVVALFVLDWLNDRAAVAEHQAARVEQALESERHANTNDQTREQAREDASAATIEQLETIHAEDPDAAAAPASAGSRAVAERLRNR